MENTMISISLKEYDTLRDKAQISVIAIDKINILDCRMRELERQVTDMSGVSNTLFDRVNTRIQRVEDKLDTSVIGRKVLK